MVGRLKRKRQRTNKNTKKNSYEFFPKLIAGLRIRTHLIRIRIQHFRLNTDPDSDPLRIQSFNDQKNLQLKKTKKIFAPVDPDSDSGSGSADPIESGSNSIPDP
jgi:hypothetical protein